MMDFFFTEHELSGARLVVPFTLLRQLGPKHHAIIVGSDDQDRIWLAELSRKHGYRLVEMSTWIEDNGRYIDGVRIEPNDGPKSNLEVAKSAVTEIQNSNANQQKYDVVLNNCENFADRHQGAERPLSQQVKQSMKLLGFVVAGGAFVLKSHLTKKTGII